MLELKADRIDIRDIEDEKANKDDLGKQLTLLQVMHSFLKHVVTVLLDFIANELPSADLSIHAITTKKAINLQ